MTFLAACGGGGSDDTDEGTLTPTTTSSPAVTASPTTDAATGTPIPTAEPTPTPAPQVDVTPVEPFDVRSAEAINVRDNPSTEGALVAVVFPGETAKVLGEASGEPVEPGDDLWYQVEVMRDGTTVQGFLYAALVVAI